MSRTISLPTALTASQNARPGTAYLVSAHHENTTQETTKITEGWHGRRQLYARRRFRLSADGWRKTPSQAVFPWVEAYPRRKRTCLDGILPQSQLHLMRFLERGLCLPGRPPFNRSSRQVHLAVWIIHPWAALRSTLSKSSHIDQRVFSYRQLPHSAGVAISQLQLGNLL